MIVRASAPVKRPPRRPGGPGPGYSWTWPSKRRIVRSDRAEIWSLWVTMTIVRPPPELGHCDLPVMGVDDTV
jgi:hypothetical protein